MLHNKTPNQHLLHRRRLHRHLHPSRTHLRHPHLHQPQRPHRYPKGMDPRGKGGRGHERATPSHGRVRPKLHNRLPSPTARHRRNRRRPILELPAAGCGSRAPALGTNRPPGLVVAGIAGSPRSALPDRRAGTAAFNRGQSCVACAAGSVLHSHGGSRRSAADSGYARGGSSAAACVDGCAGVFATFGFVGDYPAC